MTTRPRSGGGTPQCDAAHLVRVPLATATCLDAGIGERPGDLPVRRVVLPHGHHHVDDRRLVLVGHESTLCGPLAVCRPTAAVSTLCHLRCLPCHHAAPDDCTLVLGDHTEHLAH